MILPPPLTALLDIIIFCDMVYVLFSSASVQFPIASRRAGRLSVICLLGGFIVRSLICHEDLVSLTAWDMIWMKNWFSFLVAVDG